MGAKLRPGKILTGETREVWMEYLKKEYEENNKTIRELVKLTGRSYGGIHELLKQAGTKMRRHGGVPPKRVKKVKS